MVVFGRSSPCFLFFASGTWAKVKRLLPPADPSADSGTAEAGLSSTPFCFFLACMPSKTFARSMLAANSLFSLVDLVISARILLERSAFSAEICSVRLCHLKPDRYSKFQMSSR